MKWWVLVRVCGKKKDLGGVPRGQLTVLTSDGHPTIRLLRQVVEDDVMAHRSIEPGNMWTTTRLGREWNYGNWKWDPRWK